MRTITIKVDESIYDNVMFFLKNLKDKGIIIEEKNSQAKEIKKLLNNKKVTPFKNIKDPLKWQEDIRKEWEW